MGCHSEKKTELHLNGHTEQPKQLQIHQMEKHFIMILTGPIIVACQWNTAKQKGRQLRNVSDALLLIIYLCSEIILYNEKRLTKCNKLRIIIMLGLIQVLSLALLSSPTGPAEHCAGGSLPRSFSSWNRETKPGHHQPTVPLPCTNTVNSSLLLQTSQPYLEEHLLCIYIAGVAMCTAQEVLLKLN